MSRFFAAAVAVAVLAGCASAPATQPTHYWESSKAATENRYRVDNLACQTESQSAQGSAQLDPSSPSFDNYRECMVSRGYVLRQY